MTKHAVGVTGLSAAGLHLGLVIYVVGCILFAGEPDWPMYWLLVLYVDVVLAALWIASLVLSAALRAPRVGTVLLSTAAALVSRVSGLPSFSRVALTVAAVVTTVLVAAAAAGAGTLDRLTNGPNFLFPLTFLGTVGSWLAASAIVNVLRISAAISSRPGRPGIRA